jgi:hypothetical protein
VGIVRQTKVFRSLVIKRLAVPEAKADQIWLRIQNEVDSNFVSKGPGHNILNIRQKTLLFFKLVKLKKVSASALTGERVSLPAGRVKPLLVSGDEHQSRSRVELDGREYWLRVVTVFDAPNSVEAEDVTALIKALAVDCLGYHGKCLEILDGLAKECARVDQATVEDARARLEDRLPQILTELKPAWGTSLRRALNDYDREEGRLAAGKERTKALPDLKSKLWAKIQSQDAKSELLTAVRAKIEQFGYNSDRVLFELLQNADDAAVQHPPPTTSRFKLAVSRERLGVLHWGRQINQFGVADAEVGQRERWHHDLFNMLLMNLSDKREDVTGRFGLGFKSVHLLSTDVGIASGFLACRIRGGMLPEIWDAGREISLNYTQDGRRATVIDIPVEPRATAEADRAVIAFRKAARWLPAMTRRIRKIELTGSEQRVWTADFVDTETPGISIVALVGAEPGRGLALELSDETTLFLPLSADGPVAADLEVPRLWLLAPLAESLASGWLMNGRSFRVDPGRGSLARDGVEPRATFERIGETLGKRLCDLHDLLDRNWTQFAQAAGMADTSPETGPATFWRRLANLLATDLGDPIAEHLHGPDRGFGLLIRERPVLPSGLPVPFRSFLRARDARYELTGALEDPAILADLNDWASLDEVANSSVSKSASSRLTALGFAAPSTLSLAALVKNELRVEHEISPDHAGRIGRVLNRERVNTLSGTEQKGVLDAISRGRFRMADGSWREARLPPRAAADTSEEETLLLAFAPDGVVADPKYVGPALALYRLARERSGFQQGPGIYASWALSTVDPNMQSAVLRYVLKSTHGQALGEALARMRPPWLPGRSDELRSGPLVAWVALQDLPTLLGRLYPEEQRERWSINFGENNDQRAAPLSPDKLIDPTSFLKRLHEWWENEATAERARTDRNAYPDDFLPGRLAGQSGDEGREGWFTFFALGIFRTIGRSGDAQHCNFIAAAQRAGWWGDMASARLPNSPEPWVRQLEEFARADASRIDFAQWRRALVDLYVVARWLPDYVDAVLRLPGIVRQRGPVTLSDAWRLSASPLWQRLGLEGAPLTQSLGLGANWLVREAVRHGVWTGEDATAMHPYGWASTARVRELFSRYLGLDLGPEAKMDLTSSIYAHVRDKIRDRASFLGDLDLPLQIVAHGSRNDVLQELLSGAAPSDFAADPPTDDDED